MASTDKVNAVTRSLSRSSGNAQCHNRAISSPAQPDIAMPADNAMPLGVRTRARGARPSAYLKCLSISRQSDGGGIKRDLRRASRRVMSRK